MKITILVQVPQQAFLSINVSAKLVKTHGTFAQKTIGRVHQSILRKMGNIFNSTWVRIYGSDCPESD